MEKLIEKAKVLIEALPYIQAFSGKTVVIKYGGKAMAEEGLKNSFAQDIVLLKYIGLNPVVVHGGGPQINLMMKRLGLEPKFVKGVRVTDSQTMEIVEMVLGGLINKEIVALINRHGGRAVGLTGKDGGLIRAKKMKDAEGASEQGGSADMGLVGEVEKVDPQVIMNLEQDRFIPVIAPIGADPEGRTYNINADWVAGAVASSLKAEKLLLLTDVKGILDEQGRLVPTLPKKEAARLMKQGVISEGMLPKVQAALSAVEEGVTKAHIIDGRVAHALLLEIFTDKGIGTEITA
ncbi:MAG: acetylglutamate kinase [Nitrospirae bacterium]|nr:acetylglutamate kinase [Nitrospirota bacterium]